MDTQRVTLSEMKEKGDGEVGSKHVPVKIVQASGTFWLIDNLIHS